MRVPKELGLPPGTLGKLKRCCYGTRDAGALWEECYADILTSLGFKRGQACPTAFFNSERSIHLVVHGDDFVILADDEQLTWLEQQLGEHLEIGDTCRLGRDPTDSKEARILNRVVKLEEQGIRYEADPRHVEMLARDLHLESCADVSTPGVKDKNDPDDVVNEEPVHDHSEVHAVNSIKPSDKFKKVTFNNSPETKLVEIPYGRQYGRHPSEIVVHGKFGNPFVRLVGLAADPWTGKVSG